jgi:spore germination protein YaaH
MDKEKAIEVRNLKYVFTKEEALELGKELAYSNRQLAELEDQKKSLMAQMTSQISAQKEMVNLLTTKVGNGYKYVDVECEIFFHSPEKGMKKVVRTDIDDTRTEMDQVITEKMTEKDWILWNDKFQSIECDVEMHTPDVDKKTYTQRTTGIKFIENMTEDDSEQFESECEEVLLQTPKEGMKTLVHPSGLNVVLKMNEEDIEKTQLKMFPDEPKGELVEELEADGY